MIGFGQSNFKLGDYTKLTKNNIEFQFKKPMYPFEQNNESFSKGGNENLLISFMTLSKPVILQIYSNPMPSEFQQEADNFFKSNEKIESFVNQIFPPPINKIIDYRVVSLNGIKFVELKLISQNVQKQISWITFYKNNMINILGTTLIEDFEEVLPFIIDFKKSIKIK